MHKEIKFSRAHLSVFLCNLYNIVNKMFGVRDNLLWMNFLTLFSNHYKKKKKKKIIITKNKGIDDLVLLISL